MSIELDYIKIWAFYLKSHPDELYGYTSVKEYKDKFLEVRDPKVFRIEKLILDELEFSIFTNKYRNQMLVQCPLGCGLKKHEYVEVIMTADEEIQLNAFASHTEQTMDDLYRNLIYCIDLKKKYKKVINYLTETSYELKIAGGSINTSRFNMLYGFSTLFKDTIKKGT